MLTENQLKQLDSRIDHLKADIAFNEERAKQRTDLELRLVNLKELRLQVISAEDDHKESIRFCIKYQNDKRLKDSESIREAMKLASVLVQTKSDLPIEIVTPPDRIRPESHVMVNRRGKYFPLELREGTGIAEGVALMVDLSVLMSTTFAKVYISDEMFSSISPSNSLRVSSNLNEVVDGKFQVTLIEHKDEIVQMCSYREFQIVHDGINSSVVTIDHVRPPTNEME